jgi:hypothetical protein
MGKIFDFEGFLGAEAQKITDIQDRITSKVSNSIKDALSDLIDGIAKNEQSAEALTKTLSDIATAIIEKEIPEPKVTVTNQVSPSKEPEELLKAVRESMTTMATAMRAISEKQSVGKIEPIQTQRPTAYEMDVKRDKKGHIVTILVTPKYHE